MSTNCSKSVQCANVRPIESAQSHITPETRTLPRTLRAQSEQAPRTLPAQPENAPSLKALAGAVLGASLQCANVRVPRGAQSHITPETRTLPRTLPAQSEQAPRTLPAHCEGDPHIAAEEELRELVRLCGEHYQFSESELDEALQCALADPAAALTCFREISREIEAERPPTLRGEANE